MASTENNVLRALAVLAFILMAGCDKQNLIQRFASAQDQAIARQYVEYLRDGNLEQIESRADTSIASGALHDTLIRMRSLFPAQEPKSVTLVGAQAMRNPSSTVKNITFEYEFPSRWLLINIATQEKAGKHTIVGLHVIPEAMSLESQNRFGLIGKTPLEYLVLALAIGFLLLSLYALVVCVKSKLTGRKWPWILFIVLGVGKFAVNWTTGAWGLTLPAVQLFSASAAAALYGPWIISVSVPLGAIVFLLRRKTLLSAPGPAEALTTPSAP